MLVAGRYRVRSNFEPRVSAERYLVVAEIEVASDGVVIVYVDGEPLFAFATTDDFFEKCSITTDDLECITTPTGSTRS